MSNCFDTIISNYFQSDGFEPLLHDVTVERPQSHCFQPEVVEKVENFDEVKANNFITIQNETILTITNCPTVAEALSLFSISMRDFFVKFTFALCLNLKIQNAIIDEKKLHEIMLNFLNFKRSFLVSIASVVDHSFIIYWRLKDKLPIFRIKIEANTAQVGEFVVDFFVNSLRVNHNGLHPSINDLANQLPQEIFIDMLSDFRPFNLLFLASESGKFSIVQFLLKHFNVNQEINKIIPADLAFEINSYETVSVLVHANSRFPRNFNVNIENLPLNLRTFIIANLSMHNAIHSSNFEVISQIINENKNIKYFFNHLNNESALAVALRSRKFQIYKLLITKNVTLGPHENFEGIVGKLSKTSRRELTELNMDNNLSLTEPFILTLLGNSIVGLDDKLHETRSVHVLRAFVKLSKIPEVKILLQLAAAFKNFQIVFDFNRDEVQFLDPRSESYVNGVFYLNGRIYIGAMHLLDESKAHEVYGVIAHFVMFKVYKNQAKPYNKKDLFSARNFQRILEFCEMLKDHDEIVKMVFDCYGEDQQHAELIVRIPHMLGTLRDVERVKENFADLYRFYTSKCLPDLERKLQEIENPKTIHKHTNCCCVVVGLLVLTCFIICVFVIFFVFYLLAIGIVSPVCENERPLEACEAKKGECYEKIKEDCKLLKTIHYVIIISIILLIVSTCAIVGVCIFKCIRK